MAQKSRPSFQKRQKEMARQQKQKDKMARRMQGKEGEASSAPEGVDPDIAGIRPGPQAPPPEWTALEAAPAPEPEGEHRD